MRFNQTPLSSIERAAQFVTSPVENNNVVRGVSEGRTRLVDEMGMRSSPADVCAQVDLFVFFFSFFFFFFYKREKKKSK